VLVWFHVLHRVGVRPVGSPSAAGITSPAKAGTGLTSGSGWIRLVVMLESQLLVPTSGYSVPLPATLQPSCDDCYGFRVAPLDAYFPLDARIALEKP
jgi:hypothetical protein